MISKANDATHLIFQAQIGHHYGLPSSKAIASLTSVPAKALGLDHRIGYLRPGYDADIILWDSHPLRLRSSPLQVWIDGIPIVENAALNSLPSPLASTPPPQRAARPADESRTCQVGVETFIVRGIHRAFLKDASKGLSERFDPNSQLTLVLINGVIKCLDRAHDCTTWEEIAKRKGAKIIQMKRGFLVPVARNYTRR